MNRSQIHISSLALLILLFTPALLFGQSEKGALVGAVSDSTGAIVQGATLTITNLATNTSQTITTNDEGLFAAPFLVPATYKVSVTAPGFSTMVFNEVVVSVGRSENLNVVLQPGQVSEQINITESAPLLQTESASVGQVINTKQLTELPSVDRNIYSFLTLDSTVNNGPVGNAENFRVESGGSFSISGSRPSSVTFKIDGQANTDPTFGTPTITPSLDSVKEFQLQNNAYSAEFEGITQVNVATKGGTNRFHGSIFDFVQNDLLQPRNPMAPRDASGKPGKNRLRFNQFGATIGGPLLLPRVGEGGPAVFNTDRTFFFFSYEGRRNDTLNQAFPVRVLTAEERRGDFSASLGACLRAGTPLVDVPLLNPNGTPSGQCIRAGQIFDPATTAPNPLFTGVAPSALNPQFIRRPFANNQIPANRLDPTALALIAVQQPLPNFVSASDVNFLGSQGTAFKNNQYSIRLDHKFSDQDSVYGRLTVQNNRRINKVVLPFLGKNIDGNGLVFNSSWTHIFSPSVVNELRLGYVRGVYGDSLTDEIDPTQFGIENTTLNTIPRIALTAGTPLNYGGFSASVLRTIQNTYQIADNISFVMGRHALKFGGKVDHNRFQNGDLIGTNGTANFNGLFSVGNSAIGANANRNNSIADYLLGQVSSTSLNITNNANLRHTPWAAYVQDDWRVSRRVTVNLGLRYELHQPFKEESLGGRTVDLTNGGRVIVADPEVARLANSPLVVCCTGSRVVETDKNDFGPRIGVAIQPFKDNSTVIRAGYGLFYADTSQFFHWLYYVPLRGAAVFNPVTANFQTPSATLNNLFPDSRFTPPGGSGLTISIPTGVSAAALNNQPVVNIFALGSYKTPQSQQWSLGVQREFWHNMVVDISYAGNVTKNLPVQWFFNQPTFSPVAANFNSLDPAANPYLRRPFAGFTIGSNIVANVLASNYNAGTVKVDKRFSNGYSFLSTYTWSKSIDQGAEVFTTSSNHAFLPNNHDFNANRGVSVFDVPHRWVTSGILELPFGKGKQFLSGGGWQDKLFGGFRLSGVFTLQSGLPFTPYLLSSATTGRTNTGISIVERGDLVGDPYLSGDEWDAAVTAWQTLGTPLPFVRRAAININYPAGTGGNLGRNVFRAPYGRSLNLSLAKVTRLGETTQLELRMDMFNVTREVLHATNRALSVAGPAVLATSATLGTIPGRNIFFVPHTIQIGAKFIF